MKTIILSLSAFLICMYSFGQDDKHLNALELSIQKNLQSRNLLLDREFFTNKVRRNVDIFILPLNKEIIDAAVDYKHSIDGMNRSGKKKLLRKNYDKYLEGDMSAFVLLVEKFSASGNDFDLSFSEFQANTRLSDESQHYAMLRHTQVFDQPLNLGWNKGYLYFPNFRNNPYHDSYTISLAPLNSDTFTFTFDDTGIDFLRLLEDGVAANQVRNRYYLGTAPFGPDDLYKLAATIISIISMM
ncbi:MAG: hypothetical protein KFF73_18265 [Cyclobacteriaceae bacterium]|nr:hypothetical protein [Cyclobacteriaceae bacterium]